jgi:mono/diheme cytochrome c family protein
LLLLVIAFGIFYGVQQWSPSGEFARTPTYSTFSGSGSAAEAAADAATPGAVQASAPTDAARGSALYAVNCAACHQATGHGLAGVFPPLANDPVVQNPDPTDHIRTVLNGKAGARIGVITYASPMPAFRDILTDDDVAAIVNHERTSWGNAAPTVSASQVAKLRR